MGPKFYILLALPFVVIAGVFAFMFWVARAKSPRAAGWAEKLGVLNGAGRADEMERMIQYKAVSWAYLVVILGLAGLNFYEVFANEGKLPVSNLVLLAGLLTQSVAVLILRHRSTEGDEEYKPYPLWKTFAWVLGISAAIGVAGGVIVIAVLAW